MLWKRRVSSFERDPLPDYQRRILRGSLSRSMPFFPAPLARSASWRRRNCSLTKGLLTHIPRKTTAATQTGRRLDASAFVAPMSYSISSGANA